MSDAAGADFEALEEFVREASLRGSMSPLFDAASIAVINDAATSAARTRLGMFASVTESVVLHSMRVGASDALLVAVCAGNDKDEGGGIAAAICARELLRAFDSGCDETRVESALAGALVNAHSALARFATALPPSRELWTVMGKRTDLSALAALVTAVVCTREALWFAHIGSGIVVLADAHGERALTVAHTLPNAVPAADRASVRAVHRQVVLRALGFSTAGDAPKIDTGHERITRGARVIIGAAPHEHTFEDHRTLRANEATPTACVHALMSAQRDGVACACAVIDVR